MGTKQLAVDNNSVPTLSLRELIKQQPMASIPEQYVRVDQEPSLAVDLDAASLSIPVIDAQRLTVGEDRDSELEKLHSACKEWGLFMLVNHGIGTSLLAKLKHEIEEFFKLPLEEKMKYRQREGDYQGYGQRLLSVGDEQLDWADRFYMITNPSYMTKPYLLPQFPPSFRDALEMYLLESRKLAKEVALSIAKALKMEEQEMKELLEDGMQSVSMSYYPPCPKPELVMGLVPHSDANLITVILQVNGVDGLQVKNKDGAWIPVNFLPDSFVVNLGDILEIMSNGTFESPEHRVTVNSVKERISIAVLFNVNLEAEIGPSTGLISPQNPPLFKRIAMHKYLKDFLSRKTIGKSKIQFMRIDQQANPN
ncbi:hypothetical protein Nepgr_007023 [Nepenthes gracilis]|uniref:Fe2OG dioxygenase domain-containing protein n=1 Tax=Nepenthes gracilis TaxID=150966 RepID=A0AAD3S665_NEPGR|nr:hypothetical protein Nepgr_007023 [Nepenthes gracilis]